MRHLKTTDHRHAFTLIELLVVMSIVSLLIALLMPALSMTREQARSSQCLVNLRGILTAESIYISDNHDYMTIAEWRNSATVTGPNLTWAGILVGTNSLQAPMVLGQNYATHVADKPLAKDSALACPSGLTTDGFKSGVPASFDDPINLRPYIVAVSDKQNSPSGGTAQTKVWPMVDCWYGSNAGSGSYNYPMWRSASDNDVTNYKVVPHSANIKKPSKMVLFFDGNFVSNWFNGYRISASHMFGSTTNVAFADGHASSANSNLLPHSNLSDAQLRALSMSYMWTLTE